MSDRSDKKPADRQRPRAVGGRATIKRNESSLGRCIFFFFFSSLPRDRGDQAVSSESRTRCGVVSGRFQPSLLQVSRLARYDPRYDQVNPFDTNEKPLQRIVRFKRQMGAASRASIFRLTSRDIFRVPVEIYLVDESTVGQISTFLLFFFFLLRPGLSH